MNARRWRLLLGLFSGVTVFLCLIYLLRVTSEPSKMIGVREEPVSASNNVTAKPAQPMAAANENENENSMMAPDQDETLDPILTMEEHTWASGSIGMMFEFLTSDFAKPKHRHHHRNPSPAPSPAANSPRDASAGATLVQTLSLSVNPTMELASDAMQDTGTFALAVTTFESSLAIIPLSQPSLGTSANDSRTSVINQIVAPGMTTTAALTNNLVGAPLQNLVHNAQSLSPAATSASGVAVQAPTQLFTSPPLGSIWSASSISSLSSSLRPTSSLLSLTSPPSAATSSSLAGASSLGHAALGSTFRFSATTLKDPGTLTQASASLANSSPLISLSQQSVSTIAKDKPASVITQSLNPDTTAVTTTTTAIPQTVTNNWPQNTIRARQALSPTATSPRRGAPRSRMQSFTSQSLGSVSSPSSISSLSSSLRPTTSLPSATSLSSASTSSFGGAASLSHGAIHSVSSGHH
jgi:trimeric autotransporter adhesin